MFRSKGMAEVLAESSWVMVAKPDGTVVTPVMVAKPDGTVEAPAIIHDEGAGPQEEPNEGGNGGGNDGGNGGGNGNGAGNGEEDGGNGGGNGGNDGGDGGEDPDPPAEEDKDEHQEEEEEEEKEKEPELTEEEKAQKAKDLEEWHEKELANEKEREDKEREAKEAEESLQALLNDIDADKQDEAMKAAQDAAKDPIGQLPNFAAPDLPAHLDKEAEKQDVMNVKEEEGGRSWSSAGSSLVQQMWCQKLPSPRPMCQPSMQLILSDTGQCRSEAYSAWTSFWRKELDCTGIWKRNEKRGGVQNFGYRAAKPDSGSGTIGREAFQIHGAPE